ncbi:MAG: hypothetical protein H7Y36_00645, partial [Armatimonadetes bacterium]|nr:hypothetical protein [Akkermansiaceae bacterium]
MQHVFTLDTLEQAVRGSKPAKLAVLGYPVSHSSSPQLHQSALDALGIEISYIRLEVEPGKLPLAFDKMREFGFIGCNVTAPHKFEALETCSRISDQARLLGAANTVVFAGNDSLGYNTDGPGFMRAIDEAFDLKLGDTHSLILGAGGGAGQAIATQCALQKPAKLTLVNRSLDKIIALASRLLIISSYTKIFTLTFDDPNLIEYCHAADLLVQTTSLGLQKN